MPSPQVLCVMASLRGSHRGFHRMRTHNERNSGFGRLMGYLHATHGSCVHRNVWWFLAVNLWLMQSLSCQPLATSSAKGCQLCIGLATGGQCGFASPTHQREPRTCSLQHRLVPVRMHAFQVLHCLGFCQRWLCAQMTWGNFGLTASPPSLLAFSLILHP